MKISGSCQLAGDKKSYIVVVKEHFPEISLTNYFEVLYRRKKIWYPIPIIQFHYKRRVQPNFPLSFIATD
jgi:hypothetical protein